MNLPSHQSIFTAPTYVVNLKRKRERLAKTQELLKRAGFNNTVPLEAIDGVAGLHCPGTSAKRHQPLFDSFGFTTDRGGQAGCALSHLTLWNWCALGKHPGMMVFEDDALPRPDFKDIFPKYWEAISDPVDIVFVGHQLHPLDRKRGRNKLILYRSALCTHAYYITKPGAKKLLSLWEQTNPKRLALSQGKPSTYDSQHNTWEDDKYQVVDGFIFEMIRFGIGGVKVSAACMIGATTPLPPGAQYDARRWEDRDHGIVHQNRDLGSSIHEMDTVWE